MKRSGEEEEESRCCRWMELLPDEIVLNIVSRLSNEEKLELITVSWKWRRYCYETLWTIVIENPKQRKISPSFFTRAVYLEQMIIRSGGRKNYLQISDIAFDRLTRLSSLILTCTNKKRNKAVDLSPLSCLQSLTELGIEDIHSTPSDFLPHLTNLRGLFVHSNDSWITNESIIKLTKLDKLRLIQQHDITSESILQLTNLRELFLCNSPVEASLLEPILLSLTKLTMHQAIDTVNDYCQMCGLNNEILSKLTQLQSIHIISNRIEERTLRLLTNLTELLISHNNTITDEYLSTATNLVNLRLCNTQSITTKSLLRLTNLQGLELRKMEDRITEAMLSSMSNLTVNCVTQFKI